MKLLPQPKFVWEVLATESRQERLQRRRIAVALRQTTGKQWWVWVGVRFPPRLNRSSWRRKWVWRALIEAPQVSDD